MILKIDVRFLLKVLSGPKKEGIIKTLFPFFQEPKD